MCICLCDHVLSAFKWFDDSFQTPVVGKVIVFMYDPLETKRKEGKSSERVGQYLEFNASYVNIKDLQVVTCNLCDDILELFSFYVMSVVLVYSLVVIYGKRMFVRTARCVGLGIINILLHAT